MTGASRKRRSPRKRPTSSWRRSRSAWASTARTCASWSTPRCRSRSNTTSRKPAAPAATGCRPSACCCISGADFITFKCDHREVGGRGRGIARIRRVEHQAPRRHGALLPRGGVPAQGARAVLRPDVTKRRLAARATCACGDTTDVPDAQTVAKKILSCVARVKEGFGINHVIDVLRGATRPRSAPRPRRTHAPTACSRTCRKRTCATGCYQLIGQDVLVQAGDEYPLLKLNAASWEVMRGRERCG